MSTIDKDIEKLLRRPAEFPLAKLIRIADHIGVTTKRKKGKKKNYVVFFKRGCGIVVVPSVKGRKVKKCYLEEFIDVYHVEENYG